MAKVEVRLDGIYCDNTGLLEGNELEIYGWIYANMVEMWSKDVDNAVDITEHGYVNIGTTASFDLGPNDDIHLKGHLWEKDTPPIDPHDDMKFRDIDFINTFKPEGESYTLKFEESGQIVMALFTVTLLDPPSP